MKRFGIGRGSALVLYLFLLGLFLVVGIMLFINIKKFTFFYIIMYAIFFLLFLFKGNDRANRFYIELTEDYLYVKSFFRTIKVYSKKELQASYVVQRYIGTRSSGLYPSLIVSTDLKQFNKIFYYNVNLLKHEEQGVYEEYLFIILNKKRLNIILSWLNQEIDLPEINGWNDKCLEWKKVHIQGISSVQKYYKIIEGYNEHLLKAQD